MSESEVELPWMDEPLDLDEAIEAVARASQEDAVEYEEIQAAVETLKRRVTALENATTVECPSCERADEVLKSGVAAGKLARDGSLSDANIDALNQTSHVCLDCGESFTPSFEE